MKSNTIINVLHIRWSCTAVKIRRVFCVLAGLFLILPMNSSAIETVNGGMFWLSAGRIYGANSDLNTHFVDTGNYSNLASTVSAIGFGGHTVLFSRVVLGGEGQWIRPEQSTSTYSRSEMSGRFGMGHLGFIVYRSHDVSIYPLVGLGTGGMDLSLNRVEHEAGDNEPATATYTTDLSNDMTVLDAALCIEWFLNESTASRRFGFTWGLRVGYLHKLSTSDWSIADNDTADPDLGDVPSICTKGAYVRFSLGVGFMRY